LAADDLGNPLKKRPDKGARRSLPFWILPAAGGALALFAGFFIWESMGSRPNGGEPYAIAIINRPEHKAANTPPPAG
jgi:hypothetical protein